MSSDAPPRSKLVVAPAAVVPVGPTSPPPTPPATDVVLLGPPTADGAGVHVLRARDQRIEAGELRALQEGRPITGEIVMLKPREANPAVCDVTDSYAPTAFAASPAQLGHKGPAKVATNAYRDGWDEIFGAKPKAPGPAN